MTRYDFQEIVEHLPVVVYVDELDERSSPLYVSPQITTLLGYTQEEWLADPDLYVSSIHPADRERVLAEIAERNRRGVSHEHNDYRMTSRDGRVVWIRDEEIVVDGVVHGYLQEVTQHKQALIRLELLAHVLALAAEEKPPEQIISETADALAAALGDVTVTFVELTPDQQLRPRYSTGTMPPGLPAIPAAIEPLELGPLVIEDVLAEPWLEPAWATLKARGIRSAVDVPLRRNGRIVAVMWFNTPAPRRWTDDEVRILSEIAAQLDVVLERSEEREQRLVAERDLRRRDAILEAVSRVATTLLAEPDWRSAAPGLLQSLGEAVSASRAYLFENSVSPDGGLVTSQRFEWTAVEIDPELANKVMQEMSFAAVGLERLERSGSSDQIFSGIVSSFSEQERPLFEAQGIKSIMTVPIFVGGTWWGFIGFDDCVVEREWAQAEIDALRLAAQLIAAAIERQRAETSRREHEQKLRAIFASALDAIMIMNDDRVFLDVNVAACELFGRSQQELLGSRIDDFLPVARLAGVSEYWAGLRNGEPLIRDRAIVRPDGTLRQVDGAVRPDFLPGLHACFLRDVTDRKRLESDLLGAQKLESIGRLAGGVAHDFNNLLTAISGYTELLLERTGGDAVLDHDLGEILRASERATELTRQLLAFGRRQVLQPRAVNLNHVLAETGSLLRRLLGEHVELVLRPAATLGTVRVDPGQIEQVIVNLAVNARDAMPDGGCLTLTTRELEANGIDVIELEVADTGIGMDETIRAQIFEPFFTTRAEGSGLGLASVHGIVNQSAGEVTVESTPGAGSVFRVRLPRIEEQPALELAPSPPVDRTGSETILLVEDENVVRALTQRVLERCGYTVLACANGTEALAVAERCEQHIDLLLTDVVMPGLRGHEVAARVAVSRPEIKVLYMSGYAGDALLGGAAIAESALIEKPFAVDGLARRVREALSG